MGQSLTANSHTLVKFMAESSHLLLFDLIQIMRKILLKSNIYYHKALTVQY